MESLSCRAGRARLMLDAHLLVLSRCENAECAPVALPLVARMLATWCPRGLAQVELFGGQPEAVLQQIDEMPGRVSRRAVAIVVRRPMETGPPQAC